MGTVPKTLPFFIDPFRNQDKARNGNGNPKGIKGNKSAAPMEKTRVDPHHRDAQEGNARPDKPVFLLAPDNLGIRHGPPFNGAIHRRCSRNR